MIVKRNLRAVKGVLADSFYKNLEQANKISHDLLNLILTLSSSALVVTIALAEKLFPGQAGGISFPWYLIASWISLCIAIIFGIFAQLEEAIFFGNSAKETGLLMKEIDQKLSQGLTEDEYIIKDNDKYVAYNNHYWAAITMNAFILAIIFMCLALLGKKFGAGVCLAILAVAIISLVMINICLYKKMMR